ncbi:lasso peptide isopeptide bond-forming cyclase [Mesobacillus foraminis]|uniref:lasso peptide isopeptide bond-forming cyclase n=1 Tax=Mesobacillus foraminis TaxID=279826 RepID=UPI001BED136F|nr:lasso peptide isopeptide bond-forming cyclase [Mesobacillus foraminis]MBT2758431.1 lasso peptide isopeptide bond-forming cyclase [Mesobacillus foraminis]
MSAIAGIVNFNKEPVNRDYSLNMMKALEKFPADDIRVFQKDNAFLGCHAQWITRESIGEPLPFYDSVRQCAITADAIIDNRDELFEKLQVDRTKRKTMPDSQLILLSYYKWGEESPKHLVGDFAFMIWDEREQKLFGARDFSGARTLYFYQNPKQLAFCTIIQPLFSLPIKQELNEGWLAEYLAIGGMIDAVDASITPYKNIEQLPPSHSITVLNGKVTITRYSFLTPGRLRLSSNEEYEEALRDVFQKAVNARLRTYKKVGAQLSGGLDSGAVVGFAARTLERQGKTLHTFSYIPPKDFEDFTPKYLLADERPYIKSTVEYVGNITDHYLDFEGKNSYSEIDSLLEILEMPYKFFENSFWLKGMFEEARIEGVGVLLNGDRGNFTISWGSALDYYAILLKKLKWVSLFQELNFYSKNVGGPRLGCIPTIARIGFPVIDKFLPQETSERPRLINQEFARRTGIYEKFEKLGINKTGWYPETNIYKERQKHFGDVFQWNAGNTLATKLSLKYSVWKRDPTNDLRVVLFCLSVPENQYVQNGLDRALIRRATKNYLPDNVRLNQRIRGVQGADWVHRMVPFWQKIVNEIQGLSTDQNLLNYIDSQVINNAIVKFKKGVRQNFATDPDYKALMRCLILYRYINKFA